MKDLRKLSPIKKLARREVRANVYRDKHVSKNVRELAPKVGVSETAVWNWISKGKGRTGIKPTIARKVLSVLNAPLLEELDRKALARAARKNGVRRYVLKKKRIYSAEKSPRTAKRSSLSVASRQRVDPTMTDVIDAIADLRATVLLLASSLSEIRGRVPQPADEQSFKPEWFGATLSPTDKTENIAIVKE
jgi:hypothetical protein